MGRALLVQRPIDATRDTLKPFARMTTIGEMAWLVGSLRRERLLQVFGASFLALPAGYTSTNEPNGREVGIWPKTSRKTSARF